MSLPFASLLRDPDIYEQFEQVILTHTCRDVAELAYSADLVERTKTEQIEEVILALSATVDGQATAHYIADKMTGINARITRLAHGVPVGGELDYLDDGTITTALRSRA